MAAEPSTTPDPSRKYWWIVGILIPIVVAIVGTLRHESANNATSPTVIVQPGSTAELKPPCGAKLRDEHDDALKAVHEYENFITDKQSKLAIEENEQAMADSSNDKIQSDEHRGLAAELQQAIADLKESREHAAQRVRDIEQQCSY